MQISSWREASDIGIGEMVTVSRLKIESSAYGRQLKSILEKHGTQTPVYPLWGDDSSSRPDSLDILTADGGKPEHL